VVLRECRAHGSRRLATRGNERGLDGSRERRRREQIVARATALRWRKRRDRKRDATTCVWCSSLKGRKRRGRRAFAARNYADAATTAAHSSHLSARRSHPRM
jgi:hypothetical protein